MASGAGPVNLATMIEGHPDDKVALIAGGRSTTYGELREQAAALRGGLHGLGVGGGDRVAIVCGNNRHFVVAYLAAVGVGAVAVPLNPASPAPELQRQLGAVDPVAVLFEEHGARTFAHVDRAAVPSLRHVVIVDGPLPDGTVALAELMAAEPAPIADVEHDTTAVMMFTSGTAGPPRAAMLSHANLLANIDQSLRTPTHIEPDDVVYAVLPLFHIFGLNVALGISLRVGATVVLVQRFDPATAAETIVARGVTVLPGAPPIWVAFAHFDELPAATFATVRLAVSGAAKLSRSVAETCERRFGIRISEGYGLTEASPVVTSSTNLPGGPRYGSVGRTLPGVEVRVVDEQGRDVVVGDVGEVLVRGDNVFQGYYREPAATARVLDAEGWLHTGDLASIGEDGCLYLVDRAKDLVIVSGFNVFPAEVEDVLLQHPAVAEAGVIGVPHPHTGEAVKAFVRLADGAEVDEDTLIEFTLDYLARYKCPSKIVFVDELPRNLSGKLVRRELI